MTTKLTPEGAAVAAEMKRQEGTYWQARRWDHDAIALAAVEASDEVQRLRFEVRQLAAQRKHDSEELKRLRAYHDAVEAALV